jgi:hypothetical protein
MRRAERAILEQFPMDPLPVGHPPGETTMTGHLSVQALNLTVEAMVQPEAFREYARDRNC